MSKCDIIIGMIVMEHKAVLVVITAVVTPLTLTLASIASSYNIIMSAHAANIIFCYASSTGFFPCFSNMGDCMKHQKTDLDATSKCRIIHNG